MTENEKKSAEIRGYLRALEDAARVVKPNLADVDMESEYSRGEYAGRSAAAFDISALIPTGKRIPISDRWLQGYACAVATLAKLEGSSDATHVRELKGCAGLTKSSCEKAGVDEYDMEALFPVVSKESEGE